MVQAAQKDAVQVVQVDVVVVLADAMAVLPAVVHHVQVVEEVAQVVQDVMVAQDVLHNVLVVKVRVMANVLPPVTQHVLLDVEVVVQLTAPELVKILVQRRVQQIVLALALFNVLARQKLQYNEKRRNLYMKKIEINVTQEMVDYLQRLNYEVFTREEIITKLIEMHKNDTDDSLFVSKPFLKYSEELSRVKAEYEIAKLEAEKLYVPAELYGKHQYNWSVDFTTNIMTIEVLCECGIAALESVA